MYSGEIDKVLSSDPIAGSTFLGVFPSDSLPKEVPDFPFSVVANTDPASLPGKHWVAFYVDENGANEYFDSYGRPPGNMSLYNFNVDERDVCGKVDSNWVRIQGPSSDVCGHYCIDFIRKRARGLSMKDIVIPYKGKTPGKNDEKVRKTINGEFSSILKQQRGSGNEYKFGQCCCSEIQACKDRLKFYKSMR